jgi:hypothetical protein
MEDKRYTARLIKPCSNIKTALPETLSTTLSARNFVHFFLYKDNLLNATTIFNKTVKGTAYQHIHFVNL